MSDCFRKLFAMLLLSGFMLLIIHLVFIPGMSVLMGTAVRGSARWLKISNMIEMNLFSGENHKYFLTN